MRLSTLCVILITLLSLIAGFTDHPRWAVALAVAGLVLAVGTIYAMWQERKEMEQIKRRIMQ